MAPTRPPMDPRLAWLVFAFGWLVLATGLVGWLQGFPAAVAPGAALGIGLAVAGWRCARGSRYAPPVALAFAALTAVAMAQRLHDTGRLLPALPVGVFAVALFFALSAERRRRRSGGGPR